MAKDTKNKKEKKHFFKDFRAELKKVIWPTPKQLVNNTVAVITIVLITAVIVFALDFLFEKMNTYGINKIKEAVTSSNETTDNSVDTNTSLPDATTVDETDATTEQESSEEESETSDDEEASTEEE